MVVLTQISAYIMQKNSVVRKSVQALPTVYAKCLSRGTSETINGLILQIWVHYGYEDNSKGQNEKHVSYGNSITF